MEELKKEIETLKEEKAKMLIALKASNILCKMFEHLVATAKMGKHPGEACIKSIGNRAEVYKMVDEAIKHEEEK